jgi:hypothetical protein
MTRQLWLANRGREGSIDLNEASMKFDKASNRQIEMQIALWAEKLGNEVIIFIGNEQYTLDKDTVELQYDMWLGASDFSTL